jgi:hypothetical protein
MNDANYTMPSESNTFHGWHEEEEATHGGCIPPFSGNETNTNLSNVESQPTQSGQKRSSISQRDPRRIYKQTKLNDNCTYSDTIRNTIENKNKSPIEWQTIPVLRTKNNKSDSKPEILGNNISLQNRFSLLPMEITDTTDETDVSSEKDKVAQQNHKPPPIMLYGITDINKLKELFDTVVKRIDYTIKVVNNKNIKISANSVEIYKLIISLVRQENLIGHTFTRKDEKCYRVVLKNLHYSTPVTDIKEEIEKHGHKVRGEIINVRHHVTKTPLSMFFVNLEPNANNKDIFKVKYISNCVVNFEPPRKNNTIVQCMRCQQYGHTKNNCMRPHRCVKCAGAHNTTECPKNENTPATCALCLESHPANYKGCRVYKEILTRKLKSKQRTGQHQALRTENINFNLEKFPDLPNRTKAKPSSIPVERPQVSYADMLKDESRTDDKIEKLSLQIETLVQQMSNLMGLLTLVINNMYKVQ